MGLNSSVQMQCQLSTDVSFRDLPSPSSCGLDFWQSQAALNWVSSFLNAAPINIRIVDNLREASLCCLLRRLPFGFYLASAYPYGMIRGDVDLFWRGTPVIAGILRRRRVVRLEIPFTGEYAWQISDQLSTVRNSYSLNQLDAVRHVVELGPAERNQDWFMRQLSPNTRWAIRKAVRSGCTVREASESDLEVVQSIYATAMRVKGAPVNYRKARFSGMIETLSKKGYAKVYVGMVGDRPAGIAAVVDGIISRHFIQLAVLPEAQPSRLSELLVRTVIVEALESGKRYFDFMASPLSDVGLITFKAKWGATAEPIKHIAISSVPGLQHVVDLARWVNRTRARFHVS